MEFLSDLFEGVLQAAIKKGDIRKVEQLLAGGTNPNEKRRQKTPLMIAARCANVEAVTILFEKGAELEAQDNQGSTALMLAAAGWGYCGQDKEDKCLEVVKALLEKGADPNACGKRGQTAMRYALGAGNRRVMEFLREHGATDHWFYSTDRPELAGAEPLESQ